MVVLAAEDSNDRKALRVVLEALCPDMSGRCVEISDSVRLHRASGATLRERVAIIVRKAEARAARERAEMACLFVHEDWDDVDSEQRELTRLRVQAALRAATGRGHYVLAAWEVEAWLLLFPSAIEEMAPSWSVPRRLARSDTGLLQDPKRILARDRGSRSRPYREADAATVLGIAAQKGLIGEPTGTNRSWECFTADATTCCALHLPGR